LSNAPDSDREQRRFRVTHPFHPLFGREFELVHYRQCWGEDRVFYLDKGEQLRSLPSRWTSAVADNPFVVISAGRSLFRVADLLELAKVMRGVQR
jgi:Family of unknown function (DUF5372)